MAGKPTYEELEQRIRELEIEATGRKLAEEALRKNQRSLAEAQRMSGIGSWEWDPGTDTVVWSKELYNILGRDPNKYVPTYRELPSLYTPESFKRLDIAVRTALDKGTPYNLDLEMIRTDGVRRLISTRGEPMYDSTGHITGLRGTVQDITERKRVEEALRESEGRYRTLVGAIPDPVVVYDLEGRATYVNDAFVQVYGWSREALLGDRIDFVPPEETEATQEAWRRTLEDGTVFFETKRWNKNGDLLDIQLRTAILHDQEGKHVLSIVIHRDVTALKQAETALRDSEARLKALSEASFEAIFLSEKGVCLDQNQTAERIFGYTRAEAVGRHGTEWIVPEDREHVKNNMLSGYEKPYEVTALRKDGTTFPAEIQARMINYGGSNIRVTALLDITERKQAKKELRESENKHRSLLKNLPSIVYRGHRDWNVEFFDNKIELLTGYADDEFNSRKMKWSDIIVKKDIEKAKECFIYALKSDKSYVREYRIKTKAGDVLWIQDRGQIVCDDKGKIEYMDGVFFDITEDKQARQAILHAKEDWEGTFNALRELIAIVDDNYRIVRVNTAMADRLGVTPDEAIGLKCYEHVHGTKEPPPYCPHAKLLTNHREHSVEVYEEKLGGDFLIAVSPLHGPEGQLIGCVHVARDITERKQAGKEKATLENQLQQAQKMESIGTLAGGIAHDFNNILFPIVGFAEMMLYDLPEDSPHRNNINEILQGTKRAGDLVKQILTFSRQSDQKLKPLKVQLVIKEVLKLMRSLLPSTIEIKQDISNKCGLVMGDFTQTHQIAMNLMTNAFQAMEDEGGKLEVILKEVALGVDDLTDQSMAPGAYVCLTVTDTGPGMDQSVISRIFEPYFTTKENGQGTGLGLAVVHGIVKSFNGDIKVYSEPGKGTAFHVYLPVIKSQVETEEADAVAPVPKGTERILLVDDEDPIIRMETQMLERLGYDVTERTSSIEALEAFRASPDKFDLVITDMTMPNMTGIQLSQKLLDIRPDIPIIICTGFSTKIDDERAKEFGIHGFVLKPVVQSELAKKIREALGDELKIDD